MLPMEDRTILRNSSLDYVRSRIRAGAYTGHTSGLARGRVQANLVALPGEYAFDFLKFCVRNPRACPVLEVTDAGSPEPPVTAAGADLRTDLPKYRVYRDGVLVEEPTDVSVHWRDDMVAFLLGCSFTFEAALLGVGLGIAHLDQGRNVPMYVTNQECLPSGPFRGPLVVSMRPYRPEEISRVVSVTGRYPAMHGAPLNVGDASGLGIDSLAEPDFGEPVDVGEDELPVFWACGVTPQAVVRSAGLPYVITHSPGHMFITDRLNEEYEV